MDKIQRVRSAIAGHEVDRIPAGFGTHFPPAASTGRAMADAHLDFYRRSGVDFVKVMNDNPYRLVGSDRTGSIDRPIGVDHAPSRATRAAGSRTSMA
jgi:hypothetical protein